MSAGPLLPRVATHRAAFLLGSAIAVLSVYTLLRGEADWHKVYVAAARAVWVGADPYAAGYGFVYPPGALLLGLPFVAAPSAIARLAYVAINAAALAALWVHAWFLSGGAQGGGWSRRDTVVAAAGCLIAGRFVTDVLEHQQTDIVIVALVTAALWLGLRGRWISAGICCGVGAALKASPLIVFAYFLLRRRWGAAAAMLGALLAVSLLPDLIAPAGGSRLWLTHWLGNVVAAQLVGDGLGRWFTVPVLNQSLAGTLFRLVMLRWPADLADYFGVGDAAVPPPMTAGSFAAMARAVQFAAVALGFAAIAWQHRRHDVGAARDAAPAAGLDAAILLLLMVLVSPASSKPHFIATLPAALCLAHEAVVARDRWALGSAAAAALLMALSNRSWVGRTVGEPMQWAGAITWGTAILLAGCIAVAIRRGRARRDA